LSRRAKLVGVTGQPLPDFHIPHLEKIEWMIETKGWALEVVAPLVDQSPPAPGCAYTLGFPSAFGFPEVVLFGLTPSAANGIVELVADCLRGGTEIPVGAELVGLLDGDLRCLFAPIEAPQGAAFQTAESWYRGEEFDVVQMLWPDRNGFLPYEVGFDQRLRSVQPVVGTLS
jgi:Domain of unknown function (DUF4262)